MVRTALLTTFSIILFSLFIIPVKVSAASDIANSTYITYQIDERSNARITYDIELINTNSTHILSSYNLIIPYKNITELKVLENGADAKMSSLSGENSTQLGISLIKELYGKNASVKLKISFVTSDLRSKKDSLSFNIPGISFGEDVRQLNAEITAPTSLGTINFFSAGMEYVEQDEKEYKIKLPSEIAVKNLRLEFGDHRNYNFTLRYPIKNDDKRFNMYSITLPPMIAKQKVYYNFNNSVPEKSFIDTDGNIQVQYSLGPGEIKEIVISGNISITNDSGQMADDKYLEKLLGNRAYITKDLELIKQINKEVEKIKGSSTDKADFINSEVIRILSFDKSLYTNSTYSRKKADQLLSNTSQSLSIDYADLFVSIARAAKIPSRVIVGKLMNADEFGLNPSTLHAWVEIYDYDKGWVAYDPTLEEVTGYKFAHTLSTSHIALGVWGTHDDSPSVLLPFSMASSSLDDFLQIYLYQDFKRISDPNLTLKIIPGEPIIDNIHDPFDFNMHVENQTDQFAKFTDISIEGYKFDKSIVEGDKTEVIFPHSSKQVTLKVFPHPYMSMNGEDFLDIKMKAKADTEYEFRFYQKTKTSFLPIYIASWGLTFFLIIFLAFILFYRRHLYRKKHFNRVQEKYAEKPDDEILNSAVPHKLR